MKNIFNLNIKAIVALFLISLSTMVNAQVTGAEYLLSISNATATNNTMDVTLSVTVVNPSPGMRIYGFQTTINFNTAAINGGTISAAYLGGRSPELSGMSFGSLGVATAGSVRIAISSFSSGSTSVDMAQGTTLTLGTYRISNTANWGDVNANLWLQDVSQSGRTVSAINGYPYGASTPQYAYTTSLPSGSPGLTLSNLSTTPYSLPLGTLNTSHFDVNSFKYFPNEVIDNLTLSYSKSIESVTFHNLIGQEIMTRKINSNNAKLDLSRLSAGTYLMNVFVEDGASKTVKIIKK
jgi:Secretion system C-terminal sorting domain